MSSLNCASQAQKCDALWKHVAFSEQRQDSSEHKLRAVFAQEIRDLDVELPPVFGHETGRNHVPVNVAVEVGELGVEVDFHT